MRTIALIALLGMLVACATEEREPAAQRDPATTEQTAAMRVVDEMQIVFEHTYDAERERVWEAWTDCDHLPNWLLGPPGWTMTVCEVELHPGGQQRLVWEAPDGEMLEIRSTVVEVDPPRRQVVRESWGAGWPETINTLSLDEDGGRTTVQLTIEYPSEEARDAAVQSGMAEGMSFTLARLAEYLSD